MGLFRKKKQDPTELVEKKRSYEVGFGLLKAGVEKTYRVPGEKPNPSTTATTETTNPAPLVVKQEVSQRFEPQVHLHFPPVPPPAPPANSIDQLVAPSVPHRALTTPRKKSRKGSKPADLVPPSAAHYPACQAKIHRMRAGGYVAIPLTVKQGDVVIGELRGRDDGPYPFYLTDAEGERNLSNGRYARRWCASSEKLRTHPVRCPVPGLVGGQWFLVLDGQRLRSDRWVKVVLWAGPENPPKITYKPALFKRVPSHISQNTFTIAPKTNALEPKSDEPRK